VSSEDPAVKQAAIDAMEDLIVKYAAWRFDPGEVPVDAVLVVAVQEIDRQGDQCGRVGVMRRFGWQPAYITKGLLNHAMDLTRALLQPRDDI
jgi:hypothetical protein